MGRAVRPHSGLVDGARAFVLLALGAPVLWAREIYGVLGLIALIGIWFSVSLAIRTRLPLVLVCLAEALLVGLVCGIAFAQAPALLAALAVPPFAHGLWRGARGVAASVSAEAIGLVVVIGLGQAAPTADQMADVFTWLVTGFGLGLVASFLGSLADDEPDSSAPYREARLLIRELLDLSGKLSGGLDPTSMAGSILEEVSAELPVQRAVLYVRREDRLIALANQASSEELEPPYTDELADTAWSESTVQVVGHDFAFPLTTSGETIAVVSGRLAAGLDPELLGLTKQLRSIATGLEPIALRLDTAQLFAEFRDAATSDERRRLAREMHDGVAQDIASMGYIVDALISSAPTPDHEAALRQLRSMITSVVGEVRHSVMTLRTQAGSSESLGAAIAALARHLSDVSGMPIAVTADERTSRLRHEVEAELLRIAQEAMNNAVRHSHASLIDVHCRVHAPSAEIVVTDNGRGLQPGRSDSHGLSIMRERAALIGGTLEVGPRAGGGTRVSVRVGDTAGVRPADPTTPKDRIDA
ncbi:sensor histidine kinase [Nocardioides sp. LHG3406-4]|uniref:sensor histidine kinase n=1 Tax=Nocardioides sp. LHG3406-4 TaxID=2804575 RepID=UPI003CE861CA